MNVSSPSSRRAWIEISTITAGCTNMTSPSSRRAWIEIFLDLSIRVRAARVALLAEGVDRNASIDERNHFSGLSPSSRRAWIEIMTN